MYRNNRNLFPVLAVLLSAGIITSICGLFLAASDHLGGRSKFLEPTVLSTGGSNAKINDPVPTEQSVDQPVNTAAGRLARGVEAHPESTGSPNPDEHPSAILGSHTDTVLSVAAQTTAATNPLIASGSFDNTVKIWSADGKETISLTQNGRVNDLAFLTKNNRLATGGGSGEVKLWDLGTGDLVTTLSSQSGRIISLAVDPSSKYIASGSSNGTINIWNIASDMSFMGSSQAKTLTKTGPQINTLAFHPTSNEILVSGDHDGIIHVWDLNKEQPIRTLNGDVDRILSLSISNNGKYLASGSTDKLIQIWNLETGKRVQTLEGHSFVVADVAFSPDGRVLASGSYDESIKLWDWANSQELCTINGHSGFVYTVDFVGSSTLVSGGYDGTVRTWNLNVPENQACLTQ